MRRTACIALPEIRLEVARSMTSREVKSPGHQASRQAERREVRSEPLALVVARPGTEIKSERDVLGSTRLDVVSREALALGIRLGETVAAARAKTANLLVQVVAEDAVRAALVCITEAALAFGPATAFDMAQDVVWVDVGGCAHLHGGENELARAIEATVRGLGHVCRVAVADGPRIAAAVARFAPLSVETSGPLVIPEGKGAGAMRRLPISALGLDKDMSEWLNDMGLRACGDLQKLPRRALGTRLGARAHDVMQLLDGEDPTPLKVWRPTVLPAEHVDLEWGAHSLEALAFVLKTLSDRLAARLQGRGLAASRLDLVLTLDHALCERRHKSVTTLEMVLPLPLARAADLLGVIRARLERCTLSAPVLAATLRVTELSLAPTRTLDLLEPEPMAGRVLPRLVAELTAELGETQVGMLALVDTWVPDERTALVPFGRVGPVSSRRALISSSFEPSRLVRPVYLTCCMESEGDEPGNKSRHLARIESVEWWRRGVERRDLFAVWIASLDFTLTEASESASASDGSFPPRPSRLYTSYRGYRPHTTVLSRGSSAKAV